MPHQECLSSLDTRSGARLVDPKFQIELPQMEFQPFTLASSDVKPGQSIYLVDEMEPQAPLMKNQSLLDWFSDDLHLKCYGSEDYPVRCGTLTVSDPELLGFEIPTVPSEVENSLRPEQLNLPSPPSRTGQPISQMETKKPKTRNITKNYFTGLKKLLVPTLSETEKQTFLNCFPTQKNNLKINIQSFSKLFVSDLHLKVADVLKTKMMRHIIRSGIEAPEFKRLHIQNLGSLHQAAKDGIPIKNIIQQTKRGKPQSQRRSRRRTSRKNPNLRNTKPAH